VGQTEPPDAWLPLWEGPPEAGTLDDMAEVILHLIEDVMSSPWIYLALFAVAAVDGFLPVVPSEASVLTAGVFAASGETSLPLVILAAVLGAFAGDQVSYAFGHLAGPRLERRAGTAGRRRVALDRARAALAARGGVIIIVSRYFPGARTAVTLAAGVVGYRWRRFAAFGAVAAMTWGSYSALVGYVGGVAFEDAPLKGLLLGFGVAAAVTVTAELARHLVQRRRHAVAACGDALALNAR
jgi:membrane protein DedA with SNARE-associated domain